MTFTRRVLRRITWWLVASVAMLGILVALGYATVMLIVGLPPEYQQPFFIGLVIVGFPIVFLFGQLVDRIPVRSWDTWIGDLGPAEIDILIPRLEKQRDEAQE